MRKIPFTFKLFLSSMLVIAVFSAGVLYFTFERIEEFNLETAGSHLHSLGIGNSDREPAVAQGRGVGLRLRGAAAEHRRCYQRCHCHQGLVSSLRAPTASAYRLCHLCDRLCASSC